MRDEYSYRHYYNFPIELVCFLPLDFKKWCQMVADYGMYYGYQKALKETNVSSYEEYAELCVHFMTDELETDEEQGKFLFEQFGKSTIMVGIKVEMLNEFYFEEKTDDEIITLLMHLAFKSIIGNKIRVKTNWELVFKRMQGNTKPTHDTCNPIVNSYNTRRKRERIRDELMCSWGWSFYGDKTRGFYISNKENISSLIQNVKQNRKTNKIKNLKKQKREIEKYVRSTK